ncbi:DUF4241 domain-containing protein [Nannocystis radixulma]|uniref:DUF4241 domain-containing protein n=1 Tax=Nannocystis radixulma TaxID=2995305 RepID=A0ABT5BJM2_9BACT|nr:DUF4241 domain-containing protein [Nannocystis radixulma]MDC0673739.1 DUF4241 domain-containing protein [Nannocystis radixulma]
MHTDFAVAFRDGLTFVDNDGVRLTTRVVTLGDLRIESGAVALGDAFTGLAAARPEGAPIPKGSYPVDLSLVRFPLADGQADVRVAAARVRFSDEPAVAWVETLGAGVDSGTCGFTDGDVDEWTPADETASDELQNALERAVLGPSALGVRHVLGERVVFAFSSGNGDGVYAGWWGLDAAGRPVALCLDFGLLVSPVTTDVALPWPLRRGRIDHAALHAAKLGARVRWFAPKKLVLRQGGDKSAYARWKHDDGTWSSPPARFVGSGYGPPCLEIDWAARPAGAVPVIRIVEREAALTPIEVPPSPPSPAK